MEFRLDAVIGDLPSLLIGVPLTLALTVAAFLIGTTLALPLALVRIARVPVASQVALGWIEFFRTTPPLVHLVWAYYALPVLLDVRLSAFTVVAGALAFSVSAQMAEILRGGILAVPSGQTDAARVLGLPARSRLFEVVLPQALRLMLAPGCNTLVTTLKQSSLAAVIALPELMNRGQILSAETFRPLEVLTLVAGIYLILTYPLVLLSASLERRSGAAFRID
ncbi:amino acid ABC transporter permease [Elioraea sp.]|uniref:amino acid ABC transporter permease n=1 Tax=Elioraea sp. TaxID=2185103 RepID=UPI0025BD8247|nr:amino acid ABC transporter permease [Elioraea sp.]